MKKLLILALFLGFMTSCMPTTYRTKDKHGNIVHVRDTDGSIESAIILQIDSISVVAGAFDEFFKPAGYLQKDTIMFYSSYVDGREYAGYLEYKKLSVNDLHRR